VDHKIENSPRNQQFTAKLRVILQIFPSIYTFLDIFGLLEYLLTSKLYPEAKSYASERILELL